jgi:hypothetical protein
MGESLDVQAVNLDVSFLVKNQDDWIHTPART